MRLTPIDPSRLRLIGILDLPDPRDDGLDERVEVALEAGLPSLMLRDHHRSDDELRDLARRLREQTRRRGAIFLINRRPDLALDVGADGIHVGRGDATADTLRRRLGHEAVVGYSAHEAKEALGALHDGADYVTFSPIFATPSKVGILEPRGLDELRRLCAQTQGRVIALGGIDRTNAREAMEAGALGVAAIRSVFGHGADTAGAVEALLERIDRRGHGEISPTP